MKLCAKWQQNFYRPSKFKVEARSQANQKIRASGCGYQEIRTSGLAILFHLNLPGNLMA